MRERSLAFAREAWKAALVLWIAATAATALGAARGLLRPRLASLGAPVRRHRDRRGLGRIPVPAARP